MKLGVLALTMAAATLSWAANPAAPPVPAVTVSSAATASVANDRLFASLRAEVDHADPARAASEVNARMAKALARARAVAGVEAATSGYSSYQVADKSGVTRWRVTQSLSLESADFASMAALLTRLQADDMLVMSGMNFGVSSEARRKAEDMLTQEALKGWQARAQAAARGLGYGTWSVGRVTVQTGDPPMRPQPMMRAQAMAAGGAPVNLEGGNTDVTVTVSGDALLGK
jgi:predicted secreted protein